VRVEFGDRIVLRVAVSAVGRDEHRQHVCEALLDTGAQMTAISERVAEAVRPDQVDVLHSVATASGTGEAAVVEVAVRLVGGLSDAPPDVHKVRALLLPLPAADVLIGMDIIARWRVTLHNGVCEIAGAG